MTPLRLFALEDFPVDPRGKLLHERRILRGQLTRRKAFGPTRAIQQRLRVVERALIIDSLSYYYTDRAIASLTKSSEVGVRKLRIKIGRRKYAFDRFKRPYVPRFTQHEVPLGMMVAAA